MALLRAIGPKNRKESAVRQVACLGTRTYDYLPPGHHKLDTLIGPDIGPGIPIQRDDIGHHPLRNLTERVEPERPHGVGGGHTQKIRERHPRLVQRDELLGVLAMREHAAISAEYQPHAGPLRQSY